MGSYLNHCPQKSQNMKLGLFFLLGFILVSLTHGRPDPLPQLNGSGIAGGFATRTQTSAVKSGSFGANSLLQSSSGIGTPAPKSCRRYNRIKRKYEFVAC